jgi:hypothetical protein
MFKLFFVLAVLLTACSTGSKRVLINPIQTDPNSTPSKYITAEYSNQNTLSSMRAAEAYAYIDQNINIHQNGGAGVVVGMVDDGYNQKLKTASELDGKIIAASMFDTSYSGKAYLDGSFHGNMVMMSMIAGKNGSGFHGVAYNAKGVSAGLDFKSIMSGQIQNAVRYNLQNGARVINMSWGSLEISESEFAFMKDTLAKSSVLFTVAAGNGEYSVDPNDPKKPLVFRDLNGYYIPSNDFPAILASSSKGYNKSTNKGIILSVIALDSTKDGAFIASDTDREIDPWATRCSTTKAYCLGAVGEDVSVAMNGFNDIEIATGSSFAAPQVAGAAAVLMGAYPGLDAYTVGFALLRGAVPLYDQNNSIDAQILQVNYRTQGSVVQERYLSDTYGWGRLDLKGALDVISNLNSATGQSLGASRMQTSPITANLLSTGRSNVRFSDAYMSANFSLNNQVKSANRNFGFNQMNLAQSLYNNRTVDLGNFSFNIRQFNYAQGAGFMDYARVQNASINNVNFTHNLTENFNFAGAYQTFNTGDLLGIKNSSFSLTNLVNTQNVDNLPYLSLFPNAINGASFGFASDDKSYRFAYLRSNYSQAISPGLYTNFGNFNQAVQAGILTVENKNNRADIAFMSENQAFLGSVGAGVFGIAGSSSIFTTLSNTQKFGKNFTTQLSATFGTTNFRGTKGSLFQNSSQVMTDSYKFSLTHKNNLLKADKLKLQVFMPLGVRSGAVGFNGSNINLSNRNREVDFEAGYELISGDATQLGLSYLYAKNQFNTAQNNQYIFVNLSKKF